MVDAKTGNVIKKENYTIYDNWRKSAARNKRLYNTVATSNNSTPAVAQKKQSADIASVSYRVVPFPAEAPSFPGGTPTLVTNPWNLSPAGSGATTLIWNEDGLKQYVHTRGNNVVAQEDQNADDSVGTRAKGTRQNNHLYFDFTPDFNAPPTDSVNQSAAITNLFYWNNIMHDLSYQYGFDEPSGNFQRNNLGRGGKATDYVFADAQDGLGLDNANFRTKVDGKKPRMHMFLFEADPTKGFKINSPSPIAGNIVSTESAVGPNNKLADVGPVTGNLVLYDDVADTLHNGCADPANANTLKGNIALIRRGTCLFVNKILNAQSAGAIA
ncbi:MAG TPA: M36 family metallopeptidase, partial [Flavisolibacter sp.]|nr:M36 family metallopeptidase [Flavisolibacter sp.]